MQTITENISGADTLPPYQTVASGTITVSADSVNTLIYTGAVDLLTYINDGNAGTSGYTYLYVAAITDEALKITKCYGAYKLTDDPITPANNTWAITVEGDMTGISADPLVVINTPLFGYGYTNDGGGNGKIDGVTIAQGDSNNFPVPEGDYMNFGRLYKPVFVNGTSTNFLTTIYIP